MTRLTRKLPRLWLFPAVLLLVLAQSGCGSSARGASPPPAADVPGAAATAARLAATANPTPIRTPTAVTPPTPRPQARATAGGPSDAEQVAAAVARIGAALESGNLDDLKPLMLDQVAVAPGGDQGAETMDRDLAIAWLKERAAESKPKVVSNDLVESFGLLEVLTGPWDKKEPVKAGQIVFNLHRFDAQGTQDIIHGEWKIDVLIPQ